MTGEGHPSEPLAHSEDTPPHGWTVTRWVRATWVKAHEAAERAERAHQQAKAAANAATNCNQAIVRLRLDMNEAFRALGVRMRDVARRASDSQVDAQEAKRKADEVESTAIRTFIEDAKPFGRWKRDLVVFAFTVCATVAAAAICDHCGLHPIG